MISRYTPKAHLPKPYSLAYLLMAVFLLSLVSDFENYFHGLNRSIYISIKAKRCASIDGSKMVVSAASQSMCKTGPSV